MAMSTIIRERRRALGLTQEQIARTLGVSAPAVNKWEKGSTAPDVAVLPALARLLGVDLNTLFGFQEELSTEEILQFCNEVEELAAREGVAAGISRISGKIREYPNCGSLLQTASTMADGLLIMSELTRQEKEEYQQQITSWYEQAACCGDEDVRNRAVFMLAGKYLGQGELEKAQEQVDRLPERNMLDKNMMQANIFLEQKKTEEAIGLLEKGLLQRAGEVWGVLIRLVDLEIAAGDLERAARLSEIAREAADLFDLWPYNRYVGALSVALAKQDAPECIELMDRLLAAAFEPWDMQTSPLYDRTGLKHSENMGKKIVPPLLAELENEEKYDFLRSEEGFERLLRHYRRRCEA